MKIIIAPDSFKGSLSANQAALCIAEGARRAVPDAEIVLVPLADGGEGTVEALVTATGGRLIRVPATDPLGNRIDSFFGILGDTQTAVVEMAAASGLPLVPTDRRNPLLTTTYGTGELIRAAMDAGCRTLILGIGGSATNDGGVGMIQALGGSFKDGEGQEVGFGGGELSRIRSIDLSNLDPRLAKTHITVACDVDNPLTGEKGASAVFGPQKGATPDMVATLDAGLKNLADVIRKSGLQDMEFVPGAGAAGGMGGASLAFLGAELKSGIQIVMEATGFHESLVGADLVITGEGRIDSQTLQGKTIHGVVTAARAQGVPVLAIGGGIGPGAYDLLDQGAIAVLPTVNRPMSLDEAFAEAGDLLTRASEQALRIRFIRL
jgi:glycerate kinase